MVLSPTALLLAKKFDGHLILELATIAKDYFGLSLKSAQALPEFLKLIDINKKIHLCSFADSIDKKRNVTSGEEDLNPYCIVKPGLLGVHGTPLIPLQEVAEIYFGMSKKTAQAEFNSGSLERLGLKAFRLHNSQKAPIFVHITDLVDFIHAKRKITVAA